jgi:hypothetical protein
VVLRLLKLYIAFGDEESVELAERVLATDELEVLFCSWGD